MSILRHPALVAQDASPQDPDMICHLLHLTQDMAGDQHCHAARCKLPQHGTELLYAEGIQSVGGLIQYKELRF